MRTCLLVFFVYLAAVAETSLIDVAGVGNVTPDLLVLTALVWLILRGSKPAALPAAVVIGLIADLIAPGRVGLGPAAMLSVGWAVLRLRARFALDRLPGQLLTIWMAATVCALMQVVGRWLLGEMALPLGASLGRAFGVGLYTAAVGLPVMMVIGWIREPLIARRKRLAGL